jgi:hypothetical protein
VNLVCFLSVLSLLATVPTLAQNARKDGAPASSNDPSPSLDVLADPPGLLYQGVPAEIPQDEGMAGLRLELLRLGTTARLMQVVAHPDDEDGGMLTLEARGRGVSTLLMTLNRGEGGQNKIGSNLSDVLGVLRAEELLASDQYYGVQERFSHVADFGFSKNPDETFQKWGGHDTALPTCWSRAFPARSAMATGITRRRAFWRKRRFARPPIPSAFPSRLQKDYDRGRRRSFTSATFAALGR